DKKTEGVNYTAPAAGEIVAINRGHRRAFQSVVIKVAGEDHVSFEKHIGSNASDYKADSLKALLSESGMWAAIRRRPYSKVAGPNEKPSALFITAIDTHPLAADPQLVVAEKTESFKLGAKLLSKLADKTFLCVAKGSNITAEGENLTREEFDGPHPAGL